MSDEDDILARAKAIQRTKANEVHIYIRLATWQDMIAEIERLRHSEKRATDVLPDGTVVRMGK
jgi:hypothetical protein